MFHKVTQVLKDQEYEMFTFPINHSLIITILVSNIMTLHLSNRSIAKLSLQFVHSFELSTCVIQLLSTSKVLE